VEAIMPSWPGSRKTRHGDGKAHMLIFKLMVSIILNVAICGVLLFLPVGTFTGLYGIVRHPMYAGFVPFIVGMSLWLESYAAAVLASVPIGTLALRIPVEEQFLRRELQGYDAYMERVRYRLIPFLW
jgi:Phospholipid methyltransferase